ncbi:hypothetical protein SLG_23730 [Sphingobium sp. SYK-6]|uniref:hypothetical protein n=1 Tax=Sphingobium sp. (strain NBRC 103272 / SYK-6) TaxID=627192 RepID=UPI000227735F|nr:hypothetical protein [Sphingobium sp. SYK-6]BAK67048.1 hypothetical protein SLG_23730 [Sphingobium sp. SYK-6]
MRWTALIPAATLLLCACDGLQDSEEGMRGADYATEESNLAFMEDVPADALPPDTLDLSMQEVMAHVFQFSADAIWKWQGYVTDKDGERSLFPKTDAEWDQAESAGLALAELTNILLLPGRRVDDPRWAKAVADVRAAALRAARAAEDRNEDAFFDAGGRLDTACESCHLAFAPGAAKPGIRHVSEQAGEGVE